MYEDWAAERWETPFHDVESLVMVSLIDDGSLEVVLEDARGEARNRWSVCFEQVVAYRNILEEYRLALWSRREEIGAPRGWSWRLTSSDWLGALRESESLIDVHAKDARHYLIATEDDVIEVFTPEEPRIEDLGSAGDAPVAGKSVVYYRGRDDEQIEGEFARIRRKPDWMSALRRILRRGR